MHCITANEHFLQQNSFEDISQSDDSTLTDSSEIAGNVRNQADSEIIQPAKNNVEEQELGVGIKADKEELPSCPINGEISDYTKGMKADIIMIQINSSRSHFPRCFLIFISKNWSRNCCSRWLETSKRGNSEEHIQSKQSQSTQGVTKH